MPVWLEVVAISHVYGVLEYQKNPSQYLEKFSHFSLMSELQKNAKKAHTITTQVTFSTKQDFTA